MTTVEFASPSEFLAELRKDSRHVDRGIVRVAECRRASTMSPVLLVCVVGTAHVGADIYRVECICGVLCGVEGNDRRVFEKMHKQRKSLRNSCAALGFDVRSGMRKGVFSKEIG
jgi:hypothetical protein